MLLVISLRAVLEHLKIDFVNFLEICHCLRIQSWEIFSGPLWGWRCPSARVLNCNNNLLSWLYWRFFSYQSLLWDWLRPAVLWTSYLGPAPLSWRSLNGNIFIGRSTIEMKFRRYSSLIRIRQFKPFLQYLELRLFRICYGQNWYNSYPRIFF